MGKKSEHFFVNCVESKRCSKQESIKENYKRCIKCGKELSLTEEFFYKNKSSKDGYRGKCRDCISKDNKQYREENADKIKEYRQGERYKEIKKKSRTKHRDKILKQYREYYQKNREILNQKSKIRCREWRKHNKKYMREYLRMYKPTRNARENKVEGNFKIAQWRRCKEHFNNKCAYCGKKSKTICQDHFIPVKLKGEYTINNIIPACMSCNCSKNAQDFFEWYPKQPFYSKRREKKILKYLHYDMFDGQIQQLSMNI